MYRRTPHEQGVPRPGHTNVILLGLGANLPSAAYGMPRNTLTVALQVLTDAGVQVERRSRWYESPPDPPSDQPWYTNAVAVVRTDLGPAQLLGVLQDAEAALGRIRGIGNEARTADLDLLDYDSLVEAPPGGPVLPHPRMHARPFVLLPLAEVAPGWRHPALGSSVEELIAALPAGAVARPAGGHGPE